MLGNFLFHSFRKPPLPEVDGRHIAGSPIEFYADLVSPGYVIAYGQGLSFGYVQESCKFTIVTKEAGSGGLSLSVEGPSKAEIQCKDNKDGTCSVQYFPTAPGQYKITILFDDKHIVASPFTASIVPPEPAIVTYGVSAEIPLRIADTDLASLAVSVRAPSGAEFPAAVRRLTDGRVGIVFTPREIGEHVISVRRNGRHVANSPFVVRVAPSEIGDSSKVTVYWFVGSEKLCSSNHLKKIKIGQFSKTPLPMAWALNPSKPLKSLNSSSTPETLVTEA